MCCKPTPPPHHTTLPVWPQRRESLASLLRVCQRTPDDAWLNPPDALLPCLEQARDAGRGGGDQGASLLRLDPVVPASVGATAARAERRAAAGVASEGWRSCQWVGTQGRCLRHGVRALREFRSFFVVNFACWGHPVGGLDTLVQIMLERRVRSRRRLPVLGGPINQGWR